MHRLAYGRNDCDFATASRCAKKADLEFGTPHRSSHHTVCRVDDDISKMVSYLMEEGVTKEQDNRGDISFTDPLETGMHKIVDGWLRKFLIDEDRTQVKRVKSTMNT